METSYMDQLKREFRNGAHLGSPFGKPIPGMENPYSCHSLSITSPLSPVRCLRAFLTWCVEGLSNKPKITHQV